MDAILEPIFTITGEILSNMRYKNPRRRTWVLTGFFSLLGLLFLSFIVGSGISLYRQGSAVGTIVLSVIALAAFVTCCVLIVCGHKSNWVKY